MSDLGTTSNDLLKLLVQELEFCKRKREMIDTQIARLRKAPESAHTPPADVPAADATDFLAIAFDGQELDRVTPDQPLEIDELGAGPAAPFAPASPVVTAPPEVEFVVEPAPTEAAPASPVAQAAPTPTLASESAVKPDLPALVEEAAPAALVLPVIQDSSKPMMAAPEVAVGHGPVEDAPVVLAQPAPKSVARKASDEDDLV